MNYEARTGTLRIFAITLLPILALSVGNANGARPNEGGRIRLKAVDARTGRALPTGEIRVGEELRRSLVESVREPLASEPVEVGAAGQLFLHFDIGAAATRALDVEMLVWDDGARGHLGQPDVGSGWRRKGTLRTHAGQVGPISKSVVAEELKAGPTPAMAFRRDPRRSYGPYRTQSVELSGKTTLEFGYTLDESDWHSLAPVALTVSGRCKGESHTLFTTIVDAEKIGTGSPRWFDESVELSAHAGCHMTFEFKGAAVGPVSKAPHVAWSAPTVVGAPTPGAESVILVSLDGARASSFGCCGASQSATPFIDQFFGEQGTIFDAAHTPSPSTLPAHASLFTGLYPATHRVRTTSERLAQETETLPELFSGAGYSTAAFSDGVAVAPELGFASGFDSFWQSGDLDVWSTDGRAKKTFELALEWVRNRGEEPFFLFIHTNQAMWPYVPPKGYTEYFEPNAPEGVDSGSLVRYSRELRYLDDVFKFFVEELDEHRDPDRTVIMLTSGHGQEFLEHGARRSGTQLYDETIRVPLMMRGGRVRPSVKHSQVISLIDVLPTVADLVGLEIPEACDGQSAARAVTSHLPFSFSTRFAEAAASTRVGEDGKPAKWEGPVLAAVDGERKVILRPGDDGDGWKIEAYDRISDPYEHSDLSSEKPEWIASIHNDLSDYEQRLKAPEHTPLRAKLSIENRIRMRAFGYVE